VRKLTQVCGDRRGAMLVMAVLMVAVLGAIAVYTATSVTFSWRLSKRYAQRARTHAALDAGLASALVRLDAGEGRAFTAKGELSGAPYVAVCTPADGGFCTVRVDVRPPQGPGMFCEAQAAPQTDLVGAFRWVVVRYDEGKLDEAAK